MVSTLEPPHDEICWQPSTQARQVQEHRLYICMQAGLRKSQEGQPGSNLCQCLISIIPAAPKASNLTTRPGRELEPISNAPQKPMWILSPTLQFPVNHAPASAGGCRAACSCGPRIVLCRLNSLIRARSVAGHLTKIEFQSKFVLPDGAFC